MLVTKQPIVSLPIVKKFIPNSRNQIKQPPQTDSVCFSGMDYKKYAQARKALLKTQWAEGKTGMDLLEHLLARQKEWGSVGVPEANLIVTFSAEHTLVGYLVNMMRWTGLLKNTNPVPSGHPNYILGEEGEKALRKARPHLFENR